MHRPHRCSNFAQRPCRDRGLVLILVLWTLVLGALLTIQLVQTTRRDQADRVTAADRVIARWQARAGIHQAIQTLMDDSRLADYPGEDWYANAGLFRQRPLIGGTYTVYQPDESTGDNSSNASSAGVNGSTSSNAYRYGLEDEAAKLNLLTADRTALTALSGMTAETADAIVQWREHYLTNSKANSATPGNPPGSSSLPGEPAAAAPITLQTLLCGAEVEHKDIFGEDTNTNGLLDAWENDGEESPPSDNRDGYLDRGWLAKLTIYSYERNEDGVGRPRVNLNTATAEELMAKLNLRMGQADWIVANRGQGYKTILDILTQPPTASLMPENNQKPMQALERIDLATFRRIVDRITIDPRGIIPGRMNINTADATVLAALPGVDGQLAEAIVNYRQTLPQGFQSLADILEMPQITVNRLQLFVEQITVRSSVFSVRVLGYAERTGLTHLIEAVIDRGGTSPEILYWKESH